MAIYLFVLMVLSVVFGVIKTIRGSTIEDRVGTVIGTLLVLPLYIWFGWFSGLVF